jgi:hypothetical protein
MSDNILTNYNKFDEKQVDYENINKEKFYYNIYNNKINQPLHKFWFSLKKVKFSNQYNNYKTIKMLINNKSNDSIKLISFIKNLSNFMINKMSNTFPNITLDLPWKEYDNYPFLFNFYTNSKSLVVNENKDIIDFTLLNFNDSYTVLFEISSLKVIKINLDYTGNDCNYTLKINLGILMIQKESKKDLKNFLLDVINNDNQEDIYIEPKEINHFPKKTLPFLSDISSSILKKRDNDTNNDTNGEQAIKNTNSINKTNNKLFIDNNLLLKAMSSLKKVNINVKDKKEDDKDTDDDKSEINDMYISQKNSLKKVKTREKSLLNTIKRKKNKKMNREMNREKDNELDKELEKELERELEKMI